MSTLNQHKLASAIELFQSGRFQEADRLASDVLKLDPRSSAALQLRGVIAGLHLRHAEAEGFFLAAASVDSRNYFVCFNLAKALSEQGRDRESLKWHTKSLELDSKQEKAWLNYGISLSRLGEIDQAISVFNRALEINDRLAEGYSNKANCLIDRREPDQALSLCEFAIELDPGLAEAWSNRGVALNDLRRYEEALASYERAIELKPDYAEAWSNRGLTLGNFECYEEALGSFERAVELKPDYAEAWDKRGIALNDLRRYEEALESFERAVKLKPDADYVLGDLIHTQMKICLWDDLEARCQTLEKKLLTGELASAPFPVLGLFDDPKIQRCCAAIYAKRELPLTGQLGAIQRRGRGKKIRIGYFSMDFKEHPVSYLLAEVIENHSRSKFEIYGFSFGDIKTDSMCVRLKKAFDKFLEIRQLNELEIARLARDLEIDIAIDLGGYTKGSRPAIFAHRAAPIQINYLGFTGTMGTEYLDYFIGDQVTVPKESLESFSEKVIFLPNSFQANPSQRSIEPNNSSRATYNLPESGFVFCCFNNTWKLTPECITRWARILQAVPESVLWVFVETCVAKEHLENTFKRLNIDTNRLIFSNRVSRNTYFDQYRYGDLFLDTLPYNAGTTGSDALWMGLPVLTLSGKSFAGRMAASLLHALGLPELITYDAKDYESVAIELGNNPGKIALLKARLINNRAACPLFNTPLFTQHLESAYQMTYDRYHEGLAPDHIYVNA